MRIRGTQMLAQWPRCGPCAVVVCNRAVTGGRRVRHVRERPGAAARAVAGRHAALRRQHAGQPARDLRRRRRRRSTHAASVPVGLEPVAVAARTDGEVWVVNHLSDSVSIVDVASRRRRASCARCSSATSRATSSSPGRAARAPSSPPRTAARTARSIRSSRRRASAAPTSGCSTPTNLGDDARRHAAHDRRRSSATRRARSR